MDEELKRFEWKVRAGAEYVVTQPVFDLDLLEAFLKRTEHHKLPLIAGIWPLTSFRNAEFMVNELRVPVPEEYMDRMRRAENAEAARAEGIAIAREMVERVRPMVQGVQLSAPFGRYQMAIEVAEAHRRAGIAETKGRQFASNGHAPKSISASSFIPRFAGADHLDDHVQRHSNGHHFGIRSVDPGERNRHPDRFRNRAVARRRYDSHPVGSRHQHAGFDQRDHDLPFRRFSDGTTHRARRAT